MSNQKKGFTRRKSFKKSRPLPQEANVAPKIVSKTLISTYEPILSFPNKFRNTNKEERERVILGTFQKVQVTIPFLDAIRKVPIYNKFLKELCTTKCQLEGSKVISVGKMCLYIKYHKYFQFLRLFISFLGYLDE